MKLSLTGVMIVSALEWASPRIERVGARRVDDDEVAPGLEVGQRCGETVGLFLLREIEIPLGRGRERDFGRTRQAQPMPLAPAGAIAEIPAEGPLAQVEIHRPDRLAHAQERDRQMHGHGGLAGAALLIAHHDEMRLPHALTDTSDGTRRQAEGRIFRHDYPIPLRGTTPVTGRDLRMPDAATSPITRQPPAPSLPASGR